MIETQASQTINYQTAKILTRTDKINITSVYWRSPINPEQDTTTIETIISKENHIIVRDSTPIHKHGEIIKETEQGQY